MKASERANQLRQKIVDALEAHCASLDIPEYWRIKNGTVQRGYEITAYGHPHYPYAKDTWIEWENIPFLSAYLCQAYRQQREADEECIPF